MGKYFITGEAGTGKTTIIKALADRGFTAYNTDDMPEVTRLEGTSGQHVEKWPPRPVDWTKYFWNWQAEALEGLLASDTDVFVGAVTSNQEKFFDSFDKIFVLSVDTKTLRHRLLTRTDHDFGKHPGELEGILEFAPRREAELLKNPLAIKIDNTRPLTKVINEILSYASMKASAWLNLATGKLEKAGVRTARLDALILLENITGKNRSWLLAHPEFELSDLQIKKLDELIERRAGHEPLAYIRGKTEFYGREFFINKNVLEPRPESETMIDALKQLELESSSIVDIGTGSGALAITAKLETPNTEVIATDIDMKCLRVAKRNAARLGATVDFYRGDLLQPLPARSLQLSILLCNLPYVPDSFTISPAAMNEPKIAIFGGADGLDIYRKLFKQIDRLRARPKFILTESMPPQHQALAKIAGASHYRLAKTDDFIQLFTH